VYKTAYDRNISISNNKTKQQQILTQSDTHPLQLSYLCK